MCCNAFWKRVVVFCLAFGFGVLITDLSGFNKKLKIEENEKNIFIEKESKLKNCVPADGKLEYVPLTANEDKLKVPVKPEINKVKKAESKEPHPISSGENQKNTEIMLEELRKHPEIEPQQHNLLFKEKCFEAQGQK